MKPALRLLTASAGDAVLDTALSSALLARAPGEPVPAFRLSHPPQTVSFGRLDRLLPGFPAATAAAARQGFAPVLRVGGGRAAAVHEQAILFGLAGPASETTTERFVAMADLVRSALGSLGIAAAVGELPGEYCPGAWSLHAGGVKLAGIDQRVTRGGAWTEGFVMVRGGDAVRRVLEPVYAALGVEWDPRTAGSVADLVPGVTVAAAAAALRDELASRYAVREVPADPALLAHARELRARHEPQPPG